MFAPVAVSCDTRFVFVAFTAIVVAFIFVVVPSISTVAPLTSTVASENISKLVVTLNSTSPVTLCKTLAS